MKYLILMLLTLMLIQVQAGSQGDLMELQSRWAEIKYQLPADQQEKTFEALIKKVDEAVASNPDDAELLIWQGIIHASYAGVRGGLGALGEVKKAKKIFEKAIDINPVALSGSAYTSLGSLYYQVPGWPLGFGSSNKAREYLEKGLKINPDGIDSNYFFGDYLLSEGEYDMAKNSFEKALAAPPRPGRTLADQGRRQEIQAAMEVIRTKSQL